jgi:hypothetical protein
VAIAVVAAAEHRATRAGEHQILMSLATISFRAADRSPPTSGCVRPGTMVACASRCWEPGWPG